MPQSLSAADFGVDVDKQNYFGRAQGCAPWGVPEYEVRGCGLYMCVMREPLGSRK